MSADISTCANTRISRRKKTATALAVYSLFFAVYSLTMQGVPSGGDSWGYFLVTKNIVTEQSVKLAASDRVVLAPCGDGAYCGRFAIGQSLAQIPAFLKGEAFGGKITPGSDDFLFFITSFTNPAICAATAAVVFLFCAALGYGFSASLLLTALFGFGTMAWPASKTLLSEPLQMLCLAAASYLCFTAAGKRPVLRAAAAGAFAGMLILTKPSAGIAAPFLFVYLLTRPSIASRRTSAALAFAAPAAAGVFAALLYNYLRFGDWSEFGYYLLKDRDSMYRFTVPLWAGLHGLLFSSGKGLFFYVPATAAAFAAAGLFFRRNKNEAFLFGALFVSFVLVYAKWNQWHGDFAWGPRFLVPLMPFIVLPLGAAIEDFAPGRKVIRFIIFTAIFALSIFVQILGVFPRTGAYLTMAKAQPPFQIIHHPGDIRLRDDLLNQHFIPEFSPLAVHWWALKHTVADSGKTPEQIKLAMQSDFPWRSLVGNGVPSDPSWLAGYDIWTEYYDRFFPDAGGFKKFLLTFLFLMMAASVSAILFISFRKAATKGTPH